MVYVLSNMASNYTRNQGCGVMNWTQGVAGFHERTSKEPAIFWAVIWCFWVFWEPWSYKNWVFDYLFPWLIYQNPAFECLWWLRLSDSDNLDWYLMGIDTVFNTHPTLENTNWWFFVQGHMTIFRAHFVRVTVMSCKNHLDNQGRRSFSSF
jgi:mannose-6-phosphate isomerase-like protein (cupin superfamily)